MKHKALFVAALIYSALTYSQIGGKSVFQFLNLTTSPRQAALGGNVITILDEDVNQVHFNPAAVNAEMNNYLGLNYGNYYGEVTYGTGSYAYHSKKYQQTLQMGVNYINYGTFDGRDENGAQTASFSGSEIALSLGYAYAIPNSNFRIGTNAKFISSSLENYHSTGGAVDFGILYSKPKNKINAALVLTNLGTQFTTYSGTKENLPYALAIGVSRELENIPIRWHITLENLQQWDIAFANPARTVNSIDGTSTPEKISVFNNFFRHVQFGAEIFPKRVFNIRLGYNFRRAEELRILEQRNFSGISVGFGIRMNNIKFNYSYSRYTLAANTSLFGLTIQFR